MDALGVECERRLDVVVDDEGDFRLLAKSRDRTARFDDGERRDVFEPELNDGRTPLGRNPSGLDVLHDAVELHALSILPRSSSIPGSRW